MALNYAKLITKYAHNNAATAKTTRRVMESKLRAPHHNPVYITKSFIFINHRKWCLEYSSSEAQHPGNT